MKVLLSLRWTKVSMFQEFQRADRVKENLSMEMSSRTITRRVDIEKHS